MRPHPLRPFVSLVVRVCAGISAAAIVAAVAWVLAVSGCGALSESGTQPIGSDGAAPAGAQPGASPLADAEPSPPGLSAREGQVYEGGSPLGAHVGVDGGTATRLYFAVVGDTRPASEDDAQGYPFAVIAGIYQRIAALRPLPSFVVSTGDYQFASATSDSAYAQVVSYAKARALYPGPLFPAMGNHECTGATASNCDPGNPGGSTLPMAAFLELLLAPIGRTVPYYEVDVAAPDRRWTAKLVVVAANAWDAAQGAWLDTVLARPTTYTFVVRHEPASAPEAPGVTPSEAILARHPYTLLICGHKHAYGHPRKREIVVGNGGAPLTADSHYGFAVIDQQADGALAVDMIDSATGRVDPEFHFVVPFAQP